MNGIVRKSLMAMTDDDVFNAKDLYTEPGNFDQLQGASFVHSLTHDEHVYFFFRELAIEHSPDKSVYSRVGRICKNDNGHLRKYPSKYFTSFLKTRLACFHGKEWPFHFNELQSASGVIEGTYGLRKDKLIYGVFTTPENSILGSAICAFRVQDMVNSFDSGYFWDKDSKFSHHSPSPSSSDEGCASTSTRSMRR